MNTVIFGGLIVTPLDKVFEQVADGDQAALMRAYHFLADHVLFVLLEQEATAATILPKVFDLPEGKVILAFDTEERLSAFGQGGAEYAALPGRLIAQQLSGTDLLLGLNFGSGASSEVLLPTSVLDWLTNALEAAPVATSEQAHSFHAPSDLPPGFQRSLKALVNKLGGNIAAGLLVGVSYQRPVDADTAHVGLGRGHLLAFIDASPDAEPAIARAVSEVMIFSGLEAAQMDVTFLSSRDRAVSQMLEHAMVFEPEIALTEDTASNSSGPNGSTGGKPAGPPRLR